VLLPARFRNQAGYVFLGQAEVAGVALAKLHQLLPTPVLEIELGGVSQELVGRPVFRLCGVLVLGYLLTAGGYSIQRGQFVARHEDLNRARASWLPLDQAALFEPQDHLVDRGRRDTKVRL
jgi:hypothetical protein